MNKLIIGSHLVIDQNGNVPSFIALPTLLAVATLALVSCFIIYNYGDNIAVRKILVGGIGMVVVAIGGFLIFLSVSGRV